MSPWLFATDTLPAVCFAVPTFATVGVAGATGESFVPPVNSAGVPEWPWSAWKRVALDQAKILRSLDRCDTDIMTDDIEFHAKDDSLARSFATGDLRWPRVERVG